MIEPVKALIKHLLYIATIIPIISPIISNSLLTSLFLISSYDAKIAVNINGIIYITSFLIWIIMG
ncbi:hypothetical protein SDC9_188028 [bioreactor metagenome]|uniref:Uncharacterized protein n=1 Tax=bioreactor metagenome TaxID=1076179 RepID=A0A645HNS8_9ZZZZ